MSGNPIKWCVCVLQMAVRGIYIGSKGRCHRLWRGGSVEMGYRVATTWPTSHAMWRHHLFGLGFSFAAYWAMYLPSPELASTKVGPIGHPSGPTWPGLGPTCSSRSVEAHGDTLFDISWISPFVPWNAPNCILGFWNLINTKTRKLV
jgi:hypothetical protein